MALLFLVFLHERSHRWHYALNIDHSLDADHSLNAEDTLNPKGILTEDTWRVTLFGQL